MTTPEAPLEEPQVQRPSERIEQERRPYVETGWPLFRAAAARAALSPPPPGCAPDTAPGAECDVASIAQLVCGRQGATEGSYTRWATLLPGDPGVLQTGYAARWEELAPFEKCLFWWTEVHAYALELPERLEDVPFLRVQSESLLRGDRPELERLLRFMELPWNDGWLEHTGHLVDRWHHHTDESVDPMQALEHEMTLPVARRLGYDIAGVDMVALGVRYRGRPDDGLDRVGRWSSFSGTALACPGCPTAH